MGLASIDIIFQHPIKSPTLFNILATAVIGLTQKIEQPHE